jgi:hypothetical protein
MNVNPFDRLHLGYEALFGPKTRFMHIPPSNFKSTGEPGSFGEKGKGSLVEWINVPVLDLRSTAYVEYGTIGIVLLAFVGLTWVLFGKVGSVKKVEEQRKEKKKQ